MNIVKCSRFYILFFASLLSLKANANCPASTEINILADGSHSALTPNGNWYQRAERTAHRSIAGSSNSFSLKFVYAFRTVVNENGSINATKMICTYKTTNNKIMSLESVTGQEFFIASSVVFNSEYITPGWKRLEIGATCFALQGSCLFSKVS